MPHACICETCHRQMSPMFIEPSILGLAVPKREGTTICDVCYREPRQCICDAPNRLEKAFLRAYSDHGHRYNCSAARGSESDCTCGWLEVMQLAKSLGVAL